MMPYNCGLIKRYWKDKHACQYNLEFKNQAYVTVNLTNAIKEYTFFQISAARTGVRAYMDAMPLPLALTIKPLTFKIHTDID